VKSYEPSVIEVCRKHFNEVRPNSSLGYLTPAEFAAKLQQTNPSPLGQSKEQETPILSS
jgi:transposase InsO family protein